MTAIVSGRHFPVATKVTANELPLSGCRAVLTERASRHTLEVFDAEGSLLTVVSDSLLDPEAVRGSWRGVRDGKPWALVVGRSVSGPVSVTFSSGRPRTRRRIDVAPVPCGEFWLAECAISATRAAVTVAGVPAGVAALRPLPAGS